MTKILFILATLFFANFAMAYQSLLSTGDMVQPQQFQVLGYIESIFDELDGVNANVRGTYGMTDELQGDLELGVGEFDVMLGAFIKWVPIPDYEKQPAIGVRAGISYIDTDRYSQTSISAMPFVSKGVDSPQGRFTPYIGFPLAVNSNSNDTYFSSRIAFGTEWTHPEQKQIHVVAELGLELSKSFNSLTVGASYDF